MEENGIDKLKREVSEFSTDIKKITVIVSLIIAFLLGIGCHKLVSVNPDYHETLKQELSNTQKSLEDEKTAHSNTREEYDTYVAKMQPYEAQQQADEKAAAEKATAEAEAARLAAEKAAAEKAAAEAEAKRLQEEAVKSQTLGLTQSDFYNNFNAITATNGFDAFLGKTTEVGDVIKYSTLNNDVSMNCMLKNGYVENVSITIKRTTADSLTNGGEYMVSAALALDNSLTVNSADTFIGKILSGAKANIGSDYKLTKNGIDYIMNINDTSVFLYIMKARN